MKVIHIILLFITLIPLLLLTAIIVPFALLGMLANLAMIKVSVIVNDFSREIEKVFRELR